MQKFVVKTLIWRMIGEKSSTTSPEKHAILLMYATSSSQTMPILSTRDYQMTAEKRGDY